MSQKTPPSTIAVNKKARHLYELSEFLEAGISLTGPEVKSIRAGKVNFIDSYVEFKHGEAWLLSLHVAPYANAGYAPQEPDRARRLLLHTREIAKLAGGSGGGRADNAMAGVKEIFKIDEAIAQVPSIIARMIAH